MAEFLCFLEFDILRLKEIFKGLFHLILLLLLLGENSVVSEAEKHYYFLNLFFIEV